MNSIIVGNTNYKIIKNVQNEYINPKTSEKTYDYYTNDDNLKVNYFFLFETCSDASIGHWVFESAIFLIDFKNIKEQMIDCNIKILVKKNPSRKYKKLFIDLFDIESDDILYIDNQNIHGMSLCYENIPINNCCITCPNISFVTKNAVNSEKIIEFKNFILNKYSFDYIKKNENIFFRRCNEENYIPNDRKINYNEVYKLLKNKKYIEYNAMNTIFLKDQLYLLSISKNVFLDYGSSLWVNGLFCKNSNIYVSSSYNGENKSLYDYISGIFMLNLIKENNNIIFLN